MSYQLTLMNSLPDQFEIESFKTLLKGIPTSRTNCYFESKSINGFKESLHEEIQDLLIELQASEENLEKIIKIFILFLDKYEKQMLEKDDQIYNLSTENEKNQMKLSLDQSHQDPLINQNIELLEKNSQFKQEIDILETQCQKYEDIIHELKSKKISSNQQETNKFDLKKEFIKHHEKLKEELPNYFCICLGDYDEIKQQKA